MTAGKNHYSPMPEKLPQGWVKTTLGEIRLDESIGISQEQMRGETFELYSVPAFSEGKPEIVLGDAIGSNKVLVSPGDVLLCKINPRINRAWVVGESHGYRQIASAEWIVFSWQEGLSSDFLRYFFSQDAFRGYLTTNASGVGGSLMRVRPSIIGTYPFTLPPVAEQNRIVAKLNAALSGMERAEKAARRAQERLQRYRVAVLHAAVTGELTRDWREALWRNQETKPEDGKALLQRLLTTRRTRWEETELQRFRPKPANDEWKSRYEEPTPPDTSNLPDLPAGWAWARLQQLGFVVGGLTKNPRRIRLRLKLPYLRVANVYANELRLDNIATIGVDEDELDKLLLQPGDLLIVEGNGSKDQIGRLAIWDGSIERCVHQNHIIKVRLVERQLGMWVLSWFLSSLGRQQIEKVASSTTGLYTLSINKVGDLPIPLPSSTEQIEINREVERRLSAAARLATKLEQQLARTNAMRQAILREAFSGKLVSQNPNDEPASTLLERIRTEKAKKEAERKQARRRFRTKTKNRSDSMKEQTPSPELLRAAWERIGRKADARRLFDEAGFGPEDVIQFYEALRAAPELRDAFQEAAQRQRQSQKPAKRSQEKQSEPKGRFRLIELWLEDFKNLKDYTVSFEPAHGLNVVLGWNGTGKSNLFEALVIIFRDLHEWWDKNRWPSQPMTGYRLSYEMDGHIVEVTWQPASMKRPKLRRGPIGRTAEDEVQLEIIKRDQLPLPRFVFGYYSGPTNRLAEHFLPMKQAHYERLRLAPTDDAKTLAELLERRRFFCAETHHAKYVLLAFSYKDDPKISEFLKDRLRILGFESALFIIRKPRWAKSGTTAKDFWGAGGIMRRVMERLRRHAIAPMVLKQTVNYGYRSTKEDHYYFFLPDLESLYSFAAEYQDARTFFLALESTDFSELIHDVKIQVRIKATNTEQVPITFHQLSEGEQQLLMVLGLMRFTKSHQSLVLLDEPDTHLNPHWSVDYVKDLARVMSDNALESPEQQTSQILMATHDPLVIASLVKEQIHLLKRATDTLHCYWAQATEHPRGLGFTGILISDIFGFRSDLDEETQELLDKQFALATKEGSLSLAQRDELHNLNIEIERLGFRTISSDPYYRTFIEALARRREVLSFLQKPIQTPQEKQRIREAADEILARLAQEHNLTS